MLIYHTLVVNYIQKNGLKFEGKTDVGYYWCNNGIRYNRFNFRKSKLIKEGHDREKNRKMR